MSVFEVYVERKQTVRVVIDDDTVHGEDDPFSLAEDIALAALEPGEFAFLTSEVEIIDDEIEATNVAKVT